MKVMVTGGTGFIGSEVVRQLVSRGDSVVVVDNHSFGREAHLDGLDVDIRTLDIRDRDGVSAVVRETSPDAVLHLAAIHFIPYCNQHPYEATDINVRGTMNVFDACADSGVQRVFFASTAAVYPISDDPHRESDLVGPCDIYGLTKVIGERLCNEFHLKTGATVRVGRFFNAFGRNETNPHLIPEIVAQIAGGARLIRLGNLEPKRDFIHTTDLAAAVLAMTDRGGADLDICNIGSGTEFAVTEVVSAIGDAIGDTIRIEVDPARVRKVERMHLVADNTR
ncbi:MAG: NAD-dependent epimerase/dehydratase family protein, partial [Armatimonadaceae bacterium]